MMGARHHNRFVGFVVAAATGRYFIQEQFDDYKKPNEVPYKTLSLMARKTNNELATVKAQTLPGCCGVLLLHGFTGSAENCQKLIEFTTAGAKQAKYGLVLFTLRASGRTEDQLATFSNGKTGNQVTVYGKITNATYTPSTDPQED